MVRIFRLGLPIMAGIAIGLTMGEEMLSAALIGLALAATSIGITSRVLAEMGMLDRAFSRVILGAAIVDDILALLAIGVLSGLAEGDLGLDTVLTLVAGVAFVGIGLALAADHAAADALRSVSHEADVALVIVALFGVGLAIDRPFGWRRWATTWRLLGIAMPLCIAIVAVLGWGVAGLLPASALLLGAVLAPTDPVLASEVQVGGPSDDKREDEDDVRFALTSEAGLNDGLAVPILFVFIALATGADSGQDSTSMARRSPP